MITVKLISEPIRLPDWSHHLEGSDCGAHLWFLGVTREKTRSHDGEFIITRTLFYEAYESMAIRQLHRLASDASERYELSRVVIVHRLGEVPLGQSSVLVGAASKHRVGVFEALPWMMDRLKADVPIWKRETLEDSTKRWVHP